MKRALETRTLILLTVVLLLAVVIAAISAAPFITLTYYETEHYTTTETYYVTEIHTEEIPLTYEVKDARIWDFYWRISSECTVSIKNTDSEAGYFRVQFNMMTEATDTTPSRSLTKVAWRFIEAGKQNDITVRHDGDQIKSFTYLVTPSAKQVITYNEVPKTREVLQFREVEKTKKVTVLQYLIE
ncbi:MAG: hypothetical protein FJ004_04430 [Chloroflexi bacterium]|nr:hypothetical protein [Chloroflexota bacterium]MBM3176258.1 hypothetical protein [Chloroflexota bacterium]